MTDFQKRLVVCFGLLVVGMGFLCAMTEFDKTNLLLGMITVGLFFIGIPLYMPLTTYFRKVRDQLRQKNKADGDSSHVDDDVDTMENPSQVASTEKRGDDA